MKAPAIPRCGFQFSMLNSSGNSIELKNEKYEVRHKMEFAALLYQFDDRSKILAESCARSVQETIATPADCQKSRPKIDQSPVLFK